ncbi:MAG TPA: hypothetical protein VMB73_25540 [Acetobacteraceae bacterium]|nr:hypothetical protein [Acetobacteraceae bacterium]
MTATVEDLRRQIETLQRRINAPMPESERAEIAAAMSRADAVERAWGRNDAAVLGPVPGESALDYRRRLVRQYQQYSPRWKGARVEAIGYDALGNVEADVYKDAAAAAQDPKNFRPGELRAIKFRDEAGRECTKWVGDWHAAFGQFCTPGQVGYIVDPRR